MDNADLVKDAVRAQDPFKDSVRSQDPFKDSVRSQDAVKDSVRGGEGQNLFGGGGCLAVVAFIGPVGLDVGQLAARMLSGGASQGPSRRAGGKALENVAALALTAARKQDQERKKDKRLLEALKAKKK
jgi:hypothetical protein